MDTGTAITMATGAVSLLGGFVGGKRLGSGQAVSIAVDTVELLKVQVASLVTKNETKDSEITDLRARVDILEGLVTQRAEVEAVHLEVQGVRGVVDKIATKVGV